MNSLLGGFGNKLLNSMQPASVPTTQAGVSMPNLLLQAIGAAMRGESPQDFMRNLAQQHPQLKQYDFSNLSQTAQQVCQEKGVNMNDVIKQIDDIAGPLTK